MTAAARTPEIKYIENGGTLVHSVPFRFQAGSLQLRRLAPDGTISYLIEGVDFTVTGGQTDAGGAVTKTSAGVPGAELRIRRITPRTQEMDYTTADNFPAESHEQALDRLTLIVQELDREIDDFNDRALTVIDGQQLDPIDKTQFIGKYISIDPLGKLVPIDGTGNDPDLAGRLAQEDGGKWIGYNGANLQRKIGGTISLWEIVAPGDWEDIETGALEVDHAASILQGFEDGAELVLPGENPAYRIGFSQLIFENSNQWKTIRSDGTAELVGLTAQPFLLRFGGPALETNRVQLLRMQDISISALSACPIGIKATWLTDSLFERVAVAGGTLIDQQMDIDSSWDNVFSKLTAAGKNGVKLGNSNANNNQFLGLRAAGAGLGGTGFRFGSHGNAVFGADVSAYYNGVEFSGCWGSTLDGLYMESNERDIVLGLNGAAFGTRIGSGSLLQGVGANIGILQEGIHAVQGLEIAPINYRDKAVCMRTTQLCYNWRVEPSNVENPVLPVPVYWDKIGSGGFGMNVADPFNIKDQLHNMVQEFSRSTTTNTGLKFPDPLPTILDRSLLDVYKWIPFTPTFTGLTTTGPAPTITGTMRRIGDLVVTIIKIITNGGGTTASTAGTTNCTNNQAVIDAGFCVAADGSTALGYGTGWIGGAAIFPPAWAATSNTIIIGAVGLAA